MASPIGTRTEPAGVRGVGYPEKRSAREFRGKEVSEIEHEGQPRRGTR